MTSDDRPVRTIRPTSGIITLIAAAAVAVFLLGDVVVRGSWAQLLLFAPGVLAVLWVIYEVSFVSSIRMDAAGVTVQNMLRRTSFGWSRVTDIDMQWQLVFVLADGTEVTCMGGPAKARARRRSKEEGDEEPRLPAGVRELDEVRQRWRAAPATADAPIQRTWDIWALVAIVAIIVWIVAAVLVTQP